MSYAQDFFIVDADSHWSEPADLFTKNAPAAWRDKMPRVEKAEIPAFIGGKPEIRDCWVFDGAVIGPFSCAGVIDRDGNKANPHEAMFEWPFEKVHKGAYDPKTRLEVMDECGIDAQIIYPSTIGLGGENLGKAGDKAASLMSIQVYNDVQAQIQADSNNRLVPLPLMPAWDIEASIAEARRAAAMGARGINMTPNPNELGTPDLGCPEWDPFWETCVENQLPIHFHIGASVTQSTFHGAFTWGSHSNDTKLAIGGAMLFIGNAAVAINLVVSGIFDRHPDLKVVSVESGVGWVPFLLEAIEYEMEENAPDDLKRLKKTPTQAFMENMYATYWFEGSNRSMSRLVEAVGEDKILFETDFPHPTCLYPDPLGLVEDKLSHLPVAVQAKILGENSRKLYRL